MVLVAVMAAGGGVYGAWIIMECRGIGGCIPEASRVLPVS